MTASLLLIEDDHRIASFLMRGLAAEGFHITCESDGLKGLEAARGAVWDCIILDLMLPGMDGREICRTLRMEGNAAPVLMLTALDTNSDIVHGLRMGADDYLTKPFAFDVLLARVEALRRRVGGQDGTAAFAGNAVLAAHDLSLDRERMLVRRGARAIELTALEFALLEFMLAEQGKVLSRARILQNVWGVSEDPLTNVVDVYIRKLRAKIDDDEEIKLIATVRGRGYRLGV